MALAFFGGGGRIYISRPSLLPAIDGETSTRWFYLDLPGLPAWLALLLLRLQRNGARSLSISCSLIVLPGRMVQLLLPVIPLTE